MAWYKIIDLTTKMDTNIDWSPQGHKEDNFQTFSVGVEFLKEGAQAKRAQKEITSIGAIMSHFTAYHS